MGKVMLLLIAGLLLSGCATMGSLDSIKKSSDKRVASEVFNYPKGKVFQAAKLAVADAGLGIQMANEDEGKIYAKSAAKMTQLFWTGTGYGEYVGVYLIPIDENSTKVDVVVQKNYLLDIGYTDYRNIIMNNIRTILKSQN